MDKKLRLDLTIESRLEEISRIYDTISEFFEGNGIAPNVAYQFNLCIDEIVTNVVVHGLKERPDRTIDLALVLDQDDVRATVSDDGPDYDPTAAPLSDLLLPIEERAIGGLGVHFVRTMMDDFTHRRVDGRNVTSFGQHLKPRRSEP
jgi:anti-sigma regulatory factor (Ser/Thr protein kinase)